MNKSFKTNIVSIVTGDENNLKLNFNKQVHMYNVFGRLLFLTGSGSIKIIFLRHVCTRKLTLISCFEIWREKKLFEQMNQVLFFG